MRILSSLTLVVLASVSSSCVGTDADDVAELDSDALASTLRSSRLVIAENNSMTGHLTNDASRVYWTESEQPQIGIATIRLRRAAETGGSVTTLATLSLDRGSTVSSVANDANFVFVTVQTTGGYNLYRFAKTDGSSRILSKSSALVTSMVLHEGAAYLALCNDRTRGALSNCRVGRVALDGTSTTNDDALTVVPNAGAYITSLIIDSTDSSRLYWTDDGTRTAESQVGTVVTTKLPAGWLQQLKADPTRPAARTLEVVASRQQFPIAARFSDLTQDARNVYFAAGVYAGAVAVLPKDRSAPAHALVTLGFRTIVDGTPNEIAVDSRSVFFTASRANFRFDGDLVLRSDLDGANTIKLDDTDIDGSDPSPREPATTKRALITSLSQSETSLFFVATTRRDGGSSKTGRIVRIPKSR